MTYRHFKYETPLYALVLFIALAIRFIQLGSAPLTDAEAQVALQALQLSNGLKPALSGQPFYITATTLLFFLYGGGTNFLARFFPALIGSLFVLIPLLFDNRIKPRPGLILAFCIALDPGLIALSKQASSGIFALAFLLTTLGMVNKNKPRLAGVFGALALLSGASAWMGALSLGIAWGIYQLVQSRLGQSQPHVEEDARFSSKEALIPFIISFIGFGTLFFFIPNGLSAALASISDFIMRWRVAPEMPISLMLASLLIYQPVGIVIALIAMMRGWATGSKRIIPLSIWFIVSLLLAIIIPSHGMNDLAWALIPMWAMAALELARNVDIYSEERSEVAAVVGLTAFIWVFAWLDFTSLSWQTNGSPQYSLRFWLLIAAFLMLAISLLLVAAGWSIRTARLGAVWGFAVAAGSMALGGSFGAAGFRGDASPELWTPVAKPAQADLLIQTVRDLSEWGVGEDHSAPVTIAGINSPALEWALREHSPIIVDTLDTSSAPYFVITPLQDDPALSAAYRGQDFTWRETPSWNIALPYGWVRWLALREMPPTGEALILWARADLFIDAE